MKFIVLFSCLVVVFASTAPQETLDDVSNVEELVLDQEPEIHVDADGHFVLRLADQDGTTYEEEGNVLTNDKTGEELVVTKKGTYSFPSTNGRREQLVFDVDDLAEANDHCTRACGGNIYTLTAFTGIDKRQASSMVQALARIVYLSNDDLAEVTNDSSRKYTVSVLTFPTNTRRMPNNSKPLCRGCGCS